MRYELKASTEPKRILDKQRAYWEKTFTEYPNLYGLKPSYSAKKAAEIFKLEGLNKILELGGGQGRDTIFFAKNNLRVWTLEYTKKGADAIKKKAEQAGLSGAITVMRRDAREPLPFGNKSFDACYSHMLYCMALTTGELDSLAREVRRVLKPRGLSIYTVRNTDDKHYGKGIQRGEDMYEVDGFIVHFFSREKVKQLAKGYEVLDTEEFQEGPLPRNLYSVTLRKK